MSASLASRLDDVVTDLCWRQWRAVQDGGVPLGENPVRSMIDPEGLLLASLAMRAHERRLSDVLCWWVAHGAKLLSVQRIRTLRAMFPEARLAGGVEWFASRAVEADGVRWKSLVGSAPTDEPIRGAKGPKDLQLLHPATLLLRLRAGFGVGAKADVLAFLIGAASAQREREIWATVSVMASAVGYSRPSIARAVTEMKLARLVEESADRPPVYTVEVEPWARVLRLWDPYHAAARVAEGEESLHVPPWRFWTQLLAFLVACRAWIDAADDERRAPVVLASEARDLLERFGRFLAWNGIALPDPRMHPGERFGVVFRALVEDVAERVGELE